MTKARSSVIGAFLFMALAGTSALAHKGHPREGRTAHVAPKTEPHGPALNEIGAAYRQKIEPIFRRACMDCHSAHTDYPWYQRLPLVRGLIDRDIAEARTHLDMTEGYPFRSHAPPLEDLEAIEEDIREGSMPPFRYRIMHPSAALTDEEKAQVFQWAQRSKEILGAK